MNTKNATRLAGVGMVCMMAAFAVMSFTGCEEVTGLNGLSITPSSIRLNPLSNSNYVDFAVNNSVSNDLALPIMWNVSNPALGYIDYRGGYKARYFRYPASGDNVITARDQYANEGSALVKQY
ncbi:MAG: hypothetical protein WCN95_10480 [bacterium]